MKKEYSLPTDFFPRELVDTTYDFIESLSADQIRKFRAAYKREINSSKETNEIPEHTIEKRRCFLYLTTNYEKLNI